MRLNVDYEPTAHGLSKRLASLGLSASVGSRRRRAELSTPVPNCVEQ
jgi:hypothetical protein